MREAKSYCRLCFGFCGTNVTIDDDDRIVEVRGDHDNPASRGYACVKGLEVPSLLYSESRVLHPLKRVGDRHVRIGLEQALDEIAERMKTIIAEDGPQSLAFFRGTGTFGSSVAVHGWPSFAQAIGGQLFSTMTIDQSAKWVTMDRLGMWGAGKHGFEDSDVWLFAGTNPLVSVFAWHTPVQNPMKRLKEAKGSGTKIIVVDPRKCEIAKFADVHLQIYPGEDAAVAAGLIHVVLENGWEDKEFCARHVKDVERLRAEVAPFTPEMVAARAGISAEQLIAAADLFARQSKRGSVGTGTGTNMAPFPNLSEHLYEVLGVICGRFMREGDPVPNPGVLFNRTPRAEVIGPLRTFETAPKSRVRGAVRLMGESATPTLAEEIAQPGPGRIRALLISGANPLGGAIPDQAKVVEAFKALEMLVVVEPFMTETARKADYILPPKFLYEHADMTYALELTNLSYPFSQYTPALVPPPAGSELCDEGYVPWALCKRLGKTLQIDGVDLNMDVPPTDNDYLSLLARNGPIPFEVVKQTAVSGKVFDVPAKFVEPASDQAGRFDVMPDDVAGELRSFVASPSVASTVGKSSPFNFRMISRRMREVSNTSFHDLPSARTRVPYNPLCIHPDDLAQLGMTDGDFAQVVSDNGRIPAIVKTDSTLKRGVVSMTHGFGDLPDDRTDYRERGSSISLLISLDRDCEPLQAMPRMSGIPVRIEPAPAAS